MSEYQVFEQLKQLNGIRNAVFVAEIDIITEAKMNRTDVATKSIANPWRMVKKHSTLTMLFGVGAVEMENTLRAVAAAMVGEEVEGRDAKAARFHKLSTNCLCDASGTSFYVGGISLKSDVRQYTAESDTGPVVDAATVKSFIPAYRSQHVGPIPWINNKAENVHAMRIVHQFNHEDFESREELVKYVAEYCQNVWGLRINE